MYAQAHKEISIFLSWDDQYLYNDINIAGFKEVWWLHLGGWCLRASNFLSFSCSSLLCIHRELKLEVVTAINNFLFICLQSLKSLGKRPFNFTFCIFFFLLCSFLKISVTNMKRCNQETVVGWKNQSYILFNIVNFAQLQIQAEEPEKLVFQKINEIYIYIYIFFSENALMVVAVQHVMSGQEEHTQWTGYQAGCEWIKSSYGLGLRLGSSLLCVMMCVQCIYISPPEVTGSLWQHSG